MKMESCKPEDHQPVDLPQRQIGKTGLFFGPAVCLEVT
jgi:hypothetical protein